MGMIVENNKVPIKRAVDVLEDTVEKQIEHKFEPVISGGVKLQKQSGIGKFFRQLFAEDMRTVRQTFREDVLVPFMQDGISGIFHDGIDLLIYGNKGARKSSRTRGMFSNMKTRYNEKYRSSLNSSSIRRSSVDEEDEDEVSVYDDNILKITDPDGKARLKAEKVLNTLEEALEQYPSVSVADLYDVAGISNIAGDFTDKNWGWTDLRDARIRRISNKLCYLIMPRVEDIRDV